MPRSNVGRREADTRPTVSMTAAIDAANVIAAMEREAVLLGQQWAKLAPQNNGAHIGNFYAAKRKGQ